MAKSLQSNTKFVIDWQLLRLFLERIARRVGS